MSAPLVVRPVPLSPDALFKALGDKPVTLTRDLPWACPLHVGGPGTVARSAMLSTCRLCGFTSAMHAGYMATAALRRVAVQGRRR